MAAGIFQALRVAGQKALSQSTTSDIQLSSWSAALARCLFGLPWAVLILVVLIWLWGGPPKLSLTFWLWTAAAAVLQILATVQQTILLGKRNLAIGVVYVKTEVVIVALVGSTPFFAQYLTGVQWMAILISVIGVVVITRAKLGNETGSVWDLRSSADAGRRRGGGRRRTSAAWGSLESRRAILPLLWRLLIRARGCGTHWPSAWRLPGYCV